MPEIIMQMRIFLRVILPISYLQSGSIRSDSMEVEGYLAQKWGLDNLLPNENQYSSRFSSESASGSGNSLDLSNGVLAEVLTGGTEDVFGGGSGFSTSMWVKGWPSGAGESLLAKNDFSPAVYGNLRAWLDASDPKYFSIDDEGAAPPGRISSNGMICPVMGTMPSRPAPYQNSTLLGSMPGADLNGDRLILENSETGMDGWSKLHVFTTFRFDSNTRWQYLFGKTSNVNDSNVAVWHFGLRNGNWNPPQIRSWAVTNNNAYKHEGNQAPTASIKQNLGLLSILQWHKFYCKIDGTVWKTRSVSGALKSLPTIPVRLGQSSNIKFGEFVVFNDALSSSDEQKMEGYLAHKWGLEGDLPTVTPTNQVLQFPQQVGLSSGLPPGK